VNKIGRREHPDVIEGAKGAKLAAISDDAGSVVNNALARGGDRMEVCLPACV
jgi:hypothetical protein